MRRVFVSLIAVAVALSAAACEPLPPDPGPTGLYLGIQSNISPVVTPRAATDNVWGHAPNIDDHYGGTLYEGTSIETQDTRLPLVNGEQPLRMWVADPDNGVDGRPAILWFHGGGFAKGIDSMHGLADGVGRQYARRGYVSISVEYRIDTTLIGNGANPPSLCQWVQDYTGDPADPTFVARRNRCGQNIQAAQRDALAAVRYVRAHADELGIDPAKVAVGGFSAGAVIAYTTAYRWDDVGTVDYFAGDDLSTLWSRPQAALGASGMLPAVEEGPPVAIGAFDVPTSFIASRFDPAVSYPLNALTVTTARDRELVAELTSYCAEGLHAVNLYNAHKADTDVQWTTFLARWLGLYSEMRAPTADPVCPT